MVWRDSDGCIAAIESGPPILKRLRFLIGIPISAAALYLALRNVHWREVGEALQGANYWLIGVAVALLGVNLAIRTARWGLLFFPAKHLRFYHLFGSLNVAYLINNVLPLQVGDLGRAYLISELEELSHSRSLSTILVERILDVVTLLLVLLVLVPFVDVPAWATTLSIVLGVIALGVLGLIAAVTFNRDPAMKLIEWLSMFAPERIRPKLNEVAHNTLDGFAVLANPRVAALLVGWSLANWLTVGGILYLGMEAFSLGTGFSAAMFIVVATTFGFFVPSSPGSFGVYHAIVINTLENVFGVPRSVAVSYALVMHFVFYLPPILLGALFLWRERRMWQRSQLLDEIRLLQGGAKRVELADSEG